MKKEVLGVGNTENLSEFSSSEILGMLKELPDACCIFKVLTDPFGTVHDMQFLFANEKYASLVGHSSAELVGANFFETVTNRDEDWLRLSYQAAYMRQSVINRTYNTQFGKWFEFWAVPVHKKGYCAFIIHDVTAEKRREETREIVSNSNNLIIDCAKVLSSNDFRKGIKEAMKMLGTVLRADRVFIIEAHAGQSGEIYEWMDRNSGMGLPSKKDFEINDFFTFWQKQLQESNILIVEDTSIIAEKNPVIYKTVLQGKISRYAIATLKDKQEIIGYLIVDNYNPNLDVNIREVLESVAIFVSEELRNFILGKEMTYLSSHDVLTDLGNRNSFNSTLGMIEGVNVSVGVCFVDINGLKEVNDNKGHDAGDELIKEVANAVSSVFKKKYCYRIGGDEFVAVVPQVESEYFAELVEKLRKKSKKIPMAIGAIWNGTAENMEELVNAADKLMYNDKALYYENEANDRRHLGSN